jgi:diguanylate cyclase (GGDEF)-like protein
MDRISNLALICVDIDHFKRVNDVYGHDMGDQVLVAFGEILRNECRALDYCKRFGGEEFSILVASNNDDGPMRFAERLRQRIEEHRFPIPETITASLGVVRPESDPANCSHDY